MAALADAAPSRESVALLFNTRIPESRKLAETYAAARHIPAENLIGLEMPVTPDISRVEFDSTILKPLRAAFDSKRWWSRAKDRQGILVPTRNKIQVLVAFKGVPLRINQSPQPIPAPQPTDKAAADPFKDRDEASVDSELAMFGVEGLPLVGPLKNAYYQSKVGFSKSSMPFLVLTARIDAASFATCERMIRDAVETETTGLWGMCYVDIANKFPEGDKWLDELAKLSISKGIPTVIDRFNETFPAAYPMGNAAAYYGWYDWNASGPLLDPAFRFRKGAVAVHLHSFSAQQLTSASQNWCAPLLERGAAATVGNVWEPYLHFTHNLSILHENLLAGDTFVEAAWKAMPVTSWQGVVLGDPLYRPYLHLSGTGEIHESDRDFRALCAAMMQWPKDETERRAQISKAIDRTQSAVLAEALGLELLADGLTAKAVMKFRSAKAFAPAAADQLRQDLHIISIDRAGDRKSAAISSLRQAVAQYRTIPGAKAAQASLDILDPPPAETSKQGKQ